MDFDDKYIKKSIIPQVFHRFRRKSSIYVEIIDFWLYVVQNHEKSLILQKAMFLMCFL